MSVLQSVADYLAKLPPLAGGVLLGPLQAAPCAYLLCASRKVNSDITGGESQTWLLRLVVRDYALESADMARLFARLEAIADAVNDSDKAELLPQLPPPYTADSLCAEGGTIQNIDDSGIATAQISLTLRCTKGKK